MILANRIGTQIEELFEKEAPPISLDELHPVAASIAPGRLGSRAALTAGAAAILLTVFLVVAIRGPFRENPVATPIETTAFRLGLQGEAAVWAIDLETLESNVLIQDIVDAIPRDDTIAGRWTGEVFFQESDGSTTTLMVDNQAYAIGVTPNETMALTPLPVALIPTWVDYQVGYDMILARRSVDGSQWGDIPLPNCGVAYPIAGQTLDLVFAVWCSQSDDLRLFNEYPDQPYETRFPEINGRPHGPAIVDRGDNPLIVDSTGTIWSLSLGEEADLEQSGFLDLDGTEQVPGIAGLSRDQRTLYVGIATEPDLAAGRSGASRLLAFDLTTNTTNWSTETPVPFESLTVAPDGMIYAYYSAQIGDGPRPPSALMRIGPDSGIAEILISPLDLGIGRLLILGP